MKKKLSVLGVALVLSPLAAFAQVTGGTPDRCPNLPGSPTDIQLFICKLNQIVSMLMPFLIALGVLYFVWGVITYMIASDEEAKSAGRNRVVFGIIGLVVIVGLWGLVRIVTNTFGLNNVTNITLPTVPY
jgi:hypothetical protein